VPLRRLSKKPEPQAAAGGSQIQTDLDRPTADDIYEQVSRNARRELHRSVISFLSPAGWRNHHGLTALSTSIVIAQLGRSQPPGSCRPLDPIGFIAVILGRAQLFTENTL